MNLSAHAAAAGLYIFKSWYAGLLAPVRDASSQRDVSPNVITAAGIAFGAGAGAAMRAAAAGTLAAGLAVAVLLAARLACANLDGGVAARGRTGQRRSARYSTNLAIARPNSPYSPGAWRSRPGGSSCTAALAATLPSWVALAGAAAGLGAASRAAPSARPSAACCSPCWPGTGLVTAVFLAILAIGSALTALIRLARLARLATPAGNAQDDAAAR